MDPFSLSRKVCLNRKWSFTTIRETITICHRSKWWGTFTPKTFLHVASQVISQDNCILGQRESFHSPTWVSASRDLREQFLAKDFAVSNSEAVRQAVSSNPGARINEEGGDPVFTNGCPALQQPMLACPSSPRQIISSVHFPDSGSHGKGSRHVLWGKKLALGIWS